MVRIIGLTDDKTENFVVVDTGQIVNVRCGADALLSGMYQNIRGVSVCPICRTMTVVIIEGRRVTSVRPQTAMLHYVVEDESKFLISCDETFVFDKEQCLKDWLEAHHGRPGVVSTFQEFMDKAISQRGSQA